MYVVAVAPIQRGVLRTTLSFFSKQEVPVGSVVRAPIRGRMVPALAVAVTDVREHKLDVKSSGFALKKLGTAEPRALFTPALVRTLSAVADQYATTVGVLLKELSFAALLATPRSLSEPKTETVPEIVPEVLILQAEDTERMQTYRNMVRECFARKKSILILAPTLAEVARLKDELARGIEERVVVATSLESTKQLRASWERVAQSVEPLVLIGTPPVLTFPLESVDVIIVERESARAYVTRTEPSIDLRVAAEALARMRGARLVLAGFPLRVETFARRELGTADEFARAQVRTQSTARVTVLDARLSDPTRETRRSFMTLQPATYEALSETITKGGRAALYAARKGIAPLTVCNDCGTPITDPSTDVPMVLHKTPQGNVFISHRSGAVLPAERSCGVCGGWNLVSLGIGIDRVADEVRKKLPRAEVFVFTADTVATHKTAVRLIEAFCGTPGAVILGTERMLPYLPHVELGVVASIDSVLSLPSWRAHEHALETLYTLLMKSDERLIIETRRPDTAVLKSVHTGSPIEFLREETKERKFYGYPPFSTFVGLTWHGTESAVALVAQDVRAALASYDLVGPLPPELVSRGMYRQRAVIRRERGAWPEPELLTTIKSLPQSVQVTVDPDDIV